MSDVIDYNAMAASIYLTVLKLNSMATLLIGLNCIWCRLLPYDNGEDVIVQEYTLHQYECPLSLKVVTSNSDYQVGNYIVDLWGVHSEVPLEISIDISTWEAVYGAGTMPLKGDFVMIELLHKAFEVKTSSIVYTIGEEATSYKCLLGTWQHNANRKESEEFRESINDLTDSQDRLFGDAISKEVADAVVAEETAFNNTTYVDPLKTFDSNSVILQTLYGENGTTFTNAYYDFTKAELNIEYNVAATYDKSVNENHWIFTCWFKASDNDEVESGKVTLSDPKVKEKDYWWFEIHSGILIEPGDEVVIYRGNVIVLNGTIELDECEDHYNIRIATSDCLKASSKVSNWWKQGNWRILKYNNNFNIINGYSNDEKVFGISLDLRNINLTAGSSTKKVVISEGNKNNYSNWHYLAIDMCPSSTRIVLIKLIINNITGKYSSKTIVDKSVKFKFDNFEFDNLKIEDIGNNLCICHIRLYENEYALDDTYKIDMYSDVTRNASKCILVDGPLPNNDMGFVTPIK